MRRALNCPGPSKRPDVLRAIVTFSLRFRGIVVALACVLFGYGVYVALNARRYVFPDFVSPPVTVQAEAPGLAPEQVEPLVTLPLETVIKGLAIMCTTAPVL
jgi:Cu/Ag efflux pump CusA